MIDKKNKVKDAAEKLHEKSATAEEAAAPLADAAAEEGVAATASNAWEQAKDAGRRASAAVSRQYDRMSRGAHDAYGRGHGAAVEWEQNVEGYVRRNPLAVVFAGVCAGFLLGLALGRKK